MTVFVKFINPIVASVFVPPGQVQELGAQLTVLKIRLAAVHVAVPLPLYPASQVTVTAEPPTEPDFTT